MKECSVELLDGMFKCEGLGGCLVAYNDGLPSDSLESLLSSFENLPTEQLEQTSTNYRIGGQIVNNCSARQMILGKIGSILKDRP